MAIKAAEGLRSVVGRRRLLAEDAGDELAIDEAELALRIPPNLSARSGRT